MKKILVAILSSLLLGLGGIAVADPVSMVWMCTLNDGGTAERSEANGKKWVALARQLTGNDEITSSRVTAVVGETGGFMWVDTFPSIDAWAATVSAWAESDDAAALDMEFEANETCAENRLYRNVVVD